MSRLIINGESVLIGLDWQFLSDAEISTRSRKKGGVVIKGASAKQFAEGDGENGVVALASWAAANISNGIMILPLDDRRFWLCGTLAGFVAPDTDKIVAFEELPSVLALLEDIVADDLYLIRAESIVSDNDEPVLPEALEMPEIISAAQELHLEDFTIAPRVAGLSKGTSARSPLVIGVGVAASLMVAGYFGYGWWAEMQKNNEQAELAAAMQLKAQQEERQARSLADQYRATHQAMNFYEAARNILKRFDLEDSGWTLQKVEINGSVKAEYKRGHGSLAPFLEGKEHVSWSPDGGTAVMTREISADLPVPMHSYDLQPMNKIEAISLMQRIGDSGLQAGLLTAAPAWASSAYFYSPLTGTTNIYWKVASPFGRIESALSMLQHANISIGEVIFNVASRQCSIEGLIYVPKG